MNDFEKIIVTNIDTFQFKPEVDMMLVTENNIQQLEQIFKQQGILWSSRTKPEVNKNGFEPGKVLFLREYPQYDNRHLTWGRPEEALEKANENPNKPNPASEYIFVEV